MVLGLPFSLLKYGILQVSSIYVYSDSENLQNIQDIFSTYPFLTMKEVQESVLNRAVEYKNLPLLSLEDTILSAIKDARNLMVAYALVKTQIGNVNPSYLLQEISNYGTHYDIVKSLFENEFQGNSNYKEKSITSKIKDVEKASRNLLKRFYSWDLAISLLKEKFEFIEEIR